MAEVEKIKLTIKEFTMWLQGVEEMQDDSWTPSATQWKRIRDKINDIDDTPVQSPPQHVATANNSAPAVANDIPVRFASPGITPFISPSPPSNAGVAPFANAEMANTPTRTPSIDTSNGQYNSTFA